MPISFWMFVIVAVIAIVATIAVSWIEHDRMLGSLVGLGLGVIAGLFLFSASATIVGARTVGVVTSFGKADYTIDSGFHLVAPWKKVEKFDTSVKTIVMKGAEKPEDADAACVRVRLSKGQTACVDVTSAQWNIDPDGNIKDLYNTYRSFDKIESNVVLKQVQNGLVTTMADFDPLASVGTDVAIKTTTQLQTDALEKTKTALAAVPGGTGIKLNNLQIFVNYDDVTQQKLNDFGKSVAETTIATQNGKTATENAKANKALTENPAYKDPGVKYQNCLNLIRDLATRNQLDKLPPTFNCSDQGSNVLVQAK